MGELAIQKRLDGLLVALVRVQEVDPAPVELHHHRCRDDCGTMERAILREALAIERCVALGLGLLQCWCNILGEGPYDLVFEDVVLLFHPATSVMESLPAAL